MFDERAFLSWPSVIAGAVLFAALFALATLMGELVFEGTFRVTRSVVGFAVAAFAGYLGVMLLLRHGDRSSDGA